MSEGIVLYQEANYREDLQKQRKERKKMKKETRRLEKKQENDRKLLQIKFGPKDQHVKIISRQYADEINTCKEIHVISAAVSEFSIEDFPKLGQPSSHRHTSNINVVPTITSEIPSTSLTPITSNEVKQSTCRPSKRLLTVNIQEAIENPKQHVRDLSIIPNRIYTGNSLDSSLPERKEGKHREVPRPKRLTKLKSLIHKESQCPNAIEYQGIHTTNYETYCDNVITEELNENVKILLKNIVKFQENLYKRCPLKGVSKRRYVVGFREVKTYALVNKVQILIIAPNLKNTTPNGVINETVNELKTLAVTKNIPYVFALSRRILGHLTLKHIPVSCIGILRYEGSEESFENVIKVQQSAKDAYQKLLSEIQNINKNDSVETNQTNEPFLRTLQYCIYT